MKRVMTTRLDLHQSHKTAISDFVLEETPRVGDTVTVVGCDIPLTLEVIGVHHRYVSLLGSNIKRHIVEIELHLGRNWKGRSLRQFYEWYAPKFNKSVAAFI